MMIKILPPLAAVVACLFYATANATNVEVNIHNLSNEVIRTSSSDFPRTLAPGQSQSVMLNFPDTGSYINVIYTSDSGKTCRFAGRHTSHGQIAKRETSAVGSASYNNCGAIVNARKWQRPFDYRLGFWMTD